ncbi:MAG: polysaccharide biosynthesis/export family protein [Pseudomonadota bacterium]
MSTQFPQLAAAQGLSHTHRLGRLALPIIVTLALAACGLPRSGPDVAEINAPAEVASGLSFEVVPASQTMVEVTRPVETAGFATRLTETNEEPTQLIAVGDVMAVTVWENIDQGLLNPNGIGSSALPNTVVDERGFIFVPYVGLIQAAGRTLNSVREQVRAALSNQTPNPQVDIFPLSRGGRLVSVQGSVNKPGVYPIERQTRRLLPMLARAGGVSEDPEVTRIKLRRGAMVGEISLQDLYDNPANNIPVRSGDAVIAERDRRIFTALGALRGPQTVAFPTRDLSLIRAIGLAGGLIDQAADPTGVFVFRREAAPVANQVLGTNVHRTAVNVAYVFDLTAPGALFMAREFMMRDDDTLYVTNAPYLKWQKILQGIAPLVSFGGAARSLGGF